MDRMAVRRGFRIAVVATLGPIGIMLAAHTARADIPSPSLRATKEGCKVRLKASFWYHDTWLPDCQFRIYRIVPATGHEKLIFDDDAGEDTFFCTCGAAPFGPPPDPETEGRSCTPPADCGDPNAWCYCDRTCLPVYDAPGAGTVSYRLETDRGFQGIPGPLTAGAGSVDFGSECGLPDDGGGTIDGGIVDGGIVDGGIVDGGTAGGVSDQAAGGCTTSGPVAPVSWLAVFALVLLGVVFGRSGRRR